MSDTFVKRICCPACKSKKWQKWFECWFADEVIRQFLLDYPYYHNLNEIIGLEDEKYILCLCQKCGLVFQQYILNSEYNFKLYEEVINHTKLMATRTERMGLPDFARLASEVMIFIAYFKKRPSELTVLDYGMGLGHWCQMAKAFTCDTYGIEISPTLFNYAKRNGVKVISYDQLSQYQFDYINANQVLEHVREPLDTLKALAGSLKPGGLMHLDVPNCAKAKYDLQKNKKSSRLIENMRPLEHINGFDHRALVAMAELTELTPVRLPLSLQYSCNGCWLPIRKTLWYFWRPLYSNFFKRTTNLFFTKPD